MELYTCMGEAELASGTSFHGTRVKASEKELHDLFGEWPVSNDPEIGWVFVGNGAHVTIYLRNHTDIMPARTWQIEWHIGGRNKRETEEFLEWLEPKLAELRKTT